MEQDLTCRITQTSATIAALMGFQPPADSDVPNRIVLGAARKRFGDGLIERALLYNPDAIAIWLYQKYTLYFAETIALTQMALPVVSVMPSVTPVCFASMFGGVTPEVHGIKTYSKPVLRIETLFDAAIAAGKSPVILSVGEASVSKIFLEREMDYIICADETECNARAVETLKEDKHDIVVVYNGNYDSSMHRFGPESAEALTELERNNADFTLLARTAAEVWSDRRFMTAFLPDHGCHQIDGGSGSHGLDMPEDMNIVHFYGFGGKA